MKKNVLVLGFLSHFLMSPSIFAESETAPSLESPLPSIPVLVNLHSGLWIESSQALPGIGVGVQGMADQVNNLVPLHLGGELGVFGNRSASIISALFSVYYEFSDQGRVHPHIGVLFGPVFATGSNLSPRRASFFLKSGFTYDLSKNVALSANLHLGIAEATLVTTPLFGAVFTL